MIYHSITTSWLIDAFDLPSWIGSVEGTFSHMLSPQQVHKHIILCNLEKSYHGPSRLCLCDFQSMSIVIHLYQPFFTSSYVCTSILVCFANFHFCAPSFLRVLFSCLYMFIFISFTIISVIFMLYSLMHVFLSLSFTYRKCHSNLSACCLMAC